MKKKIKDLTIQDIKNICKNEKLCPKTCPLYKHMWCCLGLKNMSNKELEVKIDYDGLVK